MVVFKEPEGEHGVGLDARSRVEVEAHQLLYEVAGLRRLVTPAEAECEVVSAVDVDGAEILARGDGVGARRSIAMPELNLQTSIYERA